ncbi:MAG: alpha/beta fold hydrolase [Clostridia bacterium]|nr:alpha/beta fold hydrolase [Clostridia bacterium]
MKKLISLILSALMLFGLTTAAFAADTEKPFENSNFYTAGDYTLHYRVFEPDTAPLKQIMLIHGFCLSTVSLEGVAEEYSAKGYRTVLVDAPNFGYSSRETSTTPFLSREELIGSLMAELGGEWIVGGHSMGGGIALNLACDYPEAVTGLVLFAPQTSAHTDGTQPNPIISSLMQTVYNLILKICLKLPFLVRIFVSVSFSDSEYAKDYDLSRVTDSLALPGTGAGISLMTTHTRGPAFDRLKSLDIPCVIITAANDKVAMADNLQAIIDNAPAGTEVFEFSQGGHMMMEYAPAQVAAKTLSVIEIA